MTKLAFIKKFKNLQNIPVLSYLHLNTFLVSGLIKFSKIRILHNLILFRNKSKRSRFSKFFLRKFSCSLKNFFFQKRTLKKKISFSVFNIYQKFISFIFNNGKKNIWEKKISVIFSFLATKLFYSSTLILLKIFLRLYTKVEIKKVKTRKRSHFIPRLIKFYRSFFLSLKWLFLSLLKNKNKIPLSNKLLIELTALLRQKTSNSLLLVSSNNASVSSNRSNFTFRW